MATVNGNGPTGYGRVAKKPTLADNGANYGGAVDKPLGGGTVNSNRLLLPPVVQPTVINALAAGADAASAVASVSAAVATGARKPMVKAGKLPAASPGLQKPAAPARKRIPAPAASKPVASRKQPTATQRNAAAAGSRPQSVKPQLSADRGPPAAGMARCPLCSRDFASDRLPKHEEVCRRTRERDRKRKVFDTSKKRLEAVAAEAGVDVASFKKKVRTETIAFTYVLGMVPARSTWFWSRRIAGQTGTVRTP